ncbi:MAG TPA: hypothetical protein VIZ18_10335 [Ktedonobacteraceae bacterium]
MSIMLHTQNKVQDAGKTHPVPCFVSGKFTEARKYDVFSLANEKRCGIIILNGC